MSDGAPVLATRGLSRSFGGVTAVQDVDLTLYAGHIHGLIGPNGAGKTTMLNLLSGLLPPTAGEITLEGQRISGRRADQIAGLGVARTFQNIRLFGRMSVLDNVLAGQHRVNPVGVWGHLLWLPQSRRDTAVLRRRAASLLDQVGLLNRAGQPAASLPYGDQRRLELARALASEPKVLMLDEPVAGMNPAEERLMRDLIRQTARAGVTVLLIEHHMPFVMSLCDRVAVLNFGRLIVDDTPEAVQRHPDVIEAYLGAG
ncbi:MAG: ABC transporter ATP-binding protein [Chloroflexi bacterium]|nr:ABC transporter ATP-binding protein [Chloroflexota bacterium]